MKKLICLMVALLVSISLVVPAFAAEGEFVPSISYKNSPVLVSANFDGVDATDCLIVTSVAQAKEKTTDIHQEERDLLIRVYEELDKGTMTLSLTSDYVIRELVDINFKYENCREQGSHNNKDEELAKPDTKITVVLDLNLPKDADLVVMQYKEDKWSAVKAVNNGDGTVTLEFEHFCPVAFVLTDNGSNTTPNKPAGSNKPAASNNPKTGDIMGQNLGLWIALMAGAAVALVAVVTISRKKK